eukprot:Tamp_29618.p1 GENE.Tamp_29618~~Tamp_29618.p1  ORF type:complete len:205 (+),score=19.64 Tamp_29618:1-615(+)
MRTSTASAAGMAVLLCVGLAQCGVAPQARRSGSPHMPLRLRGGADPSGFAPPPGGYQSPASVQVDWDAAAAPAPRAATPPGPAPTMAPPAAAVPPKAPQAFDAMPAMPAAPGPAPTGSVTWDEDSSSAASQMLNLFGWENVSPFVYCGVGMLLGQLYCMLRDGPDDGMDMLEMMKGPHSLSLPSSLPLSCPLLALAFNFPRVCV